MTKKFCPCTLLAVGVIKHTPEQYQGQTLASKSSGDEHVNRIPLYFFFGENYSYAATVSWNENLISENWIEIWKKNAF